METELDALLVMRKIRREINKQTIKETVIRLRRLKVNIANSKLMYLEIEMVILNQS